MEPLLLSLLLLGAAQERPSPVSSGARAQAVASARIVRGEAVSFAAEARQPYRDTATDKGGIWQTGPQRSRGIWARPDGQTVELQEFH